MPDNYLSSSWMMRTEITANRVAHAVSCSALFTVRQVETFGRMAKARFGAPAAGGY